MREQVILLYNEDGDLITVVRPDDPLNPQFTAVELEQMGFHTKVFLVDSLQNVKQYEEDHA